VQCRLQDKIFSDILLTLEAMTFLRTQRRNCSEKFSDLE